MLDELAHADAVVLVEDRHHAQLEEAHERGAHAERAVAVAEVLLGQEHLRRLDAELAEELGVERDQMALPDRGAGLAQAERVGAPGQPEHALAHADRAAADDDDLAALLVEVAHALDEAREAPEREPGARVGDHAGAELEDDPARGADLLPARRGHCTRSMRSRKALMSIGGGRSLAANSSRASTAWARAWSYSPSRASRVAAKK